MSDVFFYFLCIIYARLKFQLNPCISYRVMGILGCIIENDDFKKNVKFVKLASFPNLISSSTIICN